MGMKHLFFSISSDAGSFVAVVPWTDDFQAKMTERLARLKKAHEEDSDLDGFTYNADVELYEITEELESWIDENDPEGYYDRDGYVALEGEPPLEERERQRLSVRELDLTCSGYYYWTMLPKHWDVTLESRMLSVEKDPFA